MVTGSGPHRNVMTPPAATASTTAFEVQPAGVPSPMTWSGCEMSAAPAAADGRAGARVEGAAESPSGMASGSASRPGRGETVNGDGLSLGTSV